MGRKVSATHRNPSQPIFLGDGLRHFPFDINGLYGNATQQPIFYLPLIKKVRNKINTYTRARAYMKVREKDGLRGLRGIRALISKEKIATQR